MLQQRTRIFPREVPRERSFPRSMPTSPNVSSDTSTYVLIITLVHPICHADLSQSIIDLLIPGQSPGIKGPIVDVSGRTDPEILFFGPDENSADLMDWAAEHARARNAPWWKSFTTGKSAAKLGGIPHDTCKYMPPIRGTNSR